MISLREKVARIMNKDTAETFDRSTDSLEALADAIAVLPTLIGSGTPNISMLETWKDVAGIDPTIWSVTNPATGTAWTRGSGTGNMAGGLRAMTAPAANETARLLSVQQWTCAPNLFGTNWMVKQLILEFEMAITVGLANLDNTNTFFGMSLGGIATRATNNSLGFALVGAGNDLQTYTDDAGAETVNTGFGEDLTQRNLFKIHAYAGHIKFYLNGTEIADHAANLPDGPMFLQFYLDTGAVGACTYQLGPVRAYELDTEV